MHLCYMHNTLIQHIAKNIQISDYDLDLCVKYFEPVHFPKKSILEKEGKIPNYLYFVISGFVRLFYNNDKGDEITTHINCPSGFITPYSSFINQTISNENLESITECKLLRIKKSDLDFLIKESSAFKDFSILVFQQSLLYNEKRSSELATLKAEERYVKLMEEHPEIFQNVPMQHIASFLGINPKSLSRIRKQIIK